MGRHFDKFLKRSSLIEVVYCFNEKFSFWNHTLRVSFLLLNVCQNSLLRICNQLQYILLFFVKEASIEHPYQVKLRGWAPSLFFVTMRSRKLLCWPPPSYHKELLRYICLNFHYCVFPLFHVCCLCDNSHSMRFCHHFAFSNSVPQNELSGNPPPHRELHFWTALLHKKVSRTKNANRGRSIKLACV